MCHMIADTEEELHAMAERIGVQRRWYQNDHYDLSINKRTAAIAAGAKEITLRECGLMMVLRLRDSSAPLVTPAEGLRIIQARNKTA